MEDNYDNKALNYARSFLRNKQQKFANKIQLSSNKQLMTELALTKLEEMTKYVSTDEPSIVRRGAFRYDRSLESERITKAQALIRRVAPGQFEDPNYLAILAYQAASIEIAYKHISIHSVENELFSKFLLGTIHVPEVNAFSLKVTKNGYTIVVLFSGLVDFIYQAAKVIVEALDPSRSADGRSAVNAVFDLESVKARLDLNPKPVELLYRTLEAYFFHGYPRATEFENIPEEHYPPLSIIVGMAERWIIGHEYGHGLAHSFENAPAEVNVNRSEEYFADCNATIVTVFSAGELDKTPPEFPIGGAIFALMCLEIIQRGFNILHTGEETVSNNESDTHPKPRDRATAVINCFRRFFDINYLPHGLFDLEFTLREQIPDKHNFSIKQSNRAYAYANILLTVWKPVKERLLEDFHNKRPLHPIWQQPIDSKSP